MSRLVTWNTRARSFIDERLPVASMLSDDEWRSRHRAVQWVLVAEIFVVFHIGVVRHVEIHMLAEAAFVGVPAVIALRAERRLLAMIAASLSMLTGAGALVHFTGGLIESHFAFFVLLPVIALYHDYRPFVVSIVYVAVTHGVMGIADPTGMYNHPAAIASPVKWGLVHAGYVLALSVVMIIHWNFAERPRLALRSALDDLRETQTQLVHAQKLESIGALAAGIAHEINTPIQFVGDNLHFLEDATADIQRLLDTWGGVRAAMPKCEATREALTLVDEVTEEIDLEFVLEEIPKAVAQGLGGIQRVSEIVQAMKGFSHPGDELALHDANGLIENTTVVSRNEWKYFADLELDLQPDLPLVLLAPGSFNQAMLNLIVNAAHAIADRFGEESGRGKITVASRTDRDMVFITVSDNGAGIPEEIQPRIFDQFFTTKGVGEGTGQGLSISRSIVEGFGGTIGFTTESGRGTRFEIGLPVAGDGSERQVA